MQAPQAGSQDFQGLSCPPATGLPYPSPAAHTDGPAQLCQIPRLDPALCQRQLASDPNPSLHREVEATAKSTWKLKVVPTPGSAHIPSPFIKKSLGWGKNTDTGSPGISPGLSLPVTVISAHQQPKLRGNGGRQVPRPAAQSLTFSLTHLSRTPHPPSFHKDWAREGGLGSVTVPDPDLWHVKAIQRAQEPTAGTCAP